MHERRAATARDGRVRPRAATLPWIGSLLVLVVLLVGAFLPWPAPSTPRASSSPRASQTAVYTLQSTWSLPPVVVEPVDLAIAPDGRSFVADAQGERVLRYDAAGRYIGAWDAPAPNAAPHRLAVDATGASLTLVWRRGTTHWHQQRDLDGLEPYRTREIPLGGVHDIDARTPATLEVLFSGSHVRVRSQDLEILSSSYLGIEARSAARIAALGDGAIALAAPDGRVFLGTDEGISVTDVISDGLPVDVARAPEGHALVYTAAPAGASEDPERVTLRAYAPDGSLQETWRPRDLDALPSAFGRALWSLDASEAGLLLSTASAGHQDYELRRIDPARRSQVLLQSLLGDLHDEARERLPGAWRIPRLPMAPSDEGLYVLDGRGRSADLLLLDEAGIAETPARDLAPVDSDLSRDDAGRLFLASPEGVLLRVQAGAGASMLASPCDCPYGGRIAAGRGASAGGIFVSRPSAAEVAVLDTDLDQRVGGFLLPDVAGLWPADLATLPGGDLLSADTASGEVQRWTPAGALSAGWLEPPAAGPVRVGTARLADGRSAAVVLRADGHVALREADGTLLAALDPEEVEGVAGPIDDIALDPAGRIYLSDAGVDAVHILAPVAGAPPTPAPMPTPQQTPSVPACRVRHDKVAHPARVVLGEEATVQLTLRADCEGSSEKAGADVVAVVDNSFYSQHRSRCDLSRLGLPQGGTLDVAAAVAEAFLLRLDARRHRAGLVANDAAGLTSLPLGSPMLDLVAALRGLVGDSDSFATLEDSLADADRQLRDGGRPESLEAIVLFTSGCSLTSGAESVEALLALGEALRARGVLIFVVQMRTSRGPAAFETLRELAGGDARFRLARSPADGAAIAADINALVTELAGAGLAGNLVVVDRLSPDVQLRAGSSSPPAAEGGDRVTWRRGLLPATGLTMTLQVLPLRLGRFPTNAEAIATYRDQDGSLRELVFPVPEIEVIAPRPSATPTREPTPTPLPPRRIHLPFALRDAGLVR